MIEIQLFGPTTVSCGDIRFTATDLGGSKPRQLLEMLALDVGVPVSQELLAERPGPRIGQCFDLVRQLLDALEHTHDGVRCTALCALSWLLDAPSADQLP